jgi:hypothetical protein
MENNQNNDNRIEQNRVEKPANQENIKNKITLFYILFLYSTNLVHITIRGLIN